MSPSHSQRIRSDLFQVPGFALPPPALRIIPPKQVRYPAGCPFASDCSPPRLAATQLSSASRVVTSHDTDSHCADKASSRTHGGPHLRAVTGVGNESEFEAAGMIGVGFDVPAG